MGTKIPYAITVRGEEVADAFDVSLQRFIHDHDVHPGDVEGCPLPDEALCKDDPNLDIKVVFDKMESFRVEWKQKEQARLPTVDIPREFQLRLVPRHQCVTPLTLTPRSEVAGLTAEVAGHTPLQSTPMSEVVCRKPVQLTPRLPPDAPPIHLHLYCQRLVFG